MFISRGSFAPTATAEVKNPHDDIAKLEHLGPVVDSVIKIADELDEIERLQHVMRVREQNHRDSKSEQSDIRHGGKRWDGWEDVMDVMHVMDRSLCDGCMDGWMDVYHKRALIYIYVGDVCFLSMHCTMSVGLEHALCMYVCMDGWMMDVVHVHDNTRS